MGEGFKERDYNGGKVPLVWSEAQRQQGVHRLEPARSQLKGNSYGVLC